MKNENNDHIEQFLNSEFSGPHESPGFLYWTKYLAWQRRINAELSPHDLTQPLFSMLAVAAWLNGNKRNCTQQSISDLTKLDRMHVSQLTKTLVSKGCISRTPDTKDRRVLNLKVTKKGYDRLKVCLPLVEAIDKNIL